jgi:hypothetical protein
MLLQLQQQQPREQHQKTKAAMDFGFIPLAAAACFPKVEVPPLTPHSTPQQPCGRVQDWSYRLARCSLQALAMKRATTR